MRHSQGSHAYLIALGSNQRHRRFGRPGLALQAAIEALAASGLRVVAQSRIISSRPVGPSIRTYANAVIQIECTLEPPDLLDLLHAVEADFGRKRSGQRWRARPLDLDIILWSGGCWCEPSLTIPHPLFRGRKFVLEPAQQIAARWRDPVTGFHIKHLLSRLDRKRPLA